MLLVPPMFIRNQLGFSNKTIVWFKQLWLGAEISITFYWILFFMWIIYAMNAVDTHYIATMAGLKVCAKATFKGWHIVKKGTGTSDKWYKVQRSWQGWTDCVLS